MNEDDIKHAIYNKTILMIAGLDGEARYEALNERRREIAGMIELAQHLGLTPALRRFLERERDYLRGRIEAAM